MFIPIFYLMLTRILCTLGSNVGSTLFYNRFNRNNVCWSEGDIAKLRARKLFEQIVPSLVTPERISSRYISGLLNYYRGAFRLVEKNKDKRTSTILREGLADTIGGHLRSEALPTARFAYYAGYIPYLKVRELHDFYDHIRTILNTQGLGWKGPDKIPEWSNLTVSKILIGNGKYFKPCSSLVIKRDASSCMHLSSPVLDDNREPSAIALPLKTGGLASLASPMSDNILLKYYTTAARCILHSSPAACRHTDFVNFNNDMWHWMKRNVAPHLTDEKLYAAYGGVLRIAAAVQSYGRGLSRRNLFDIQNSGASKWQPWKALTETYVYVNTDWTPHLYVGVVILAGISIFLMQICFNFLLSDDEGCTCRARSKPEASNDVEYANVESTIPAMLPSHWSERFYGENEEKKRRGSSNITSSIGSYQTQKVYDLNDNTEKLMAVAMSEMETSSAGSTASTDEETGSESEESIKKRSPSPPKIETSVSQVQLSKITKKLRSSSSATRSERVYRQRTTDSNSSGSSTSGQSTLSSSSKSRCRQSRSSRDLAWARRVVSKHALQRKSVSGTELECSSFTTPPSRR